MAAPAASAAQLRPLRGARARYRVVPARALLLIACIAISTGMCATASTTLTFRSRVVLDNVRGILFPRRYRDYRGDIADFTPTGYNIFTQKSFVDDVERALRLYWDFDQLGVPPLLPYGSAAVGSFLGDRAGGAVGSVQTPKWPDRADPVPPPSAIVTRRDPAVDVDEQPGPTSFTDRVETTVFHSAANASAWLQQQTGTVAARRRFFASLVHLDLDLPLGAIYRTSSTASTRRCSLWPIVLRYDFAARSHIRVSSFHRAPQWCGNEGNTPREHTVAAAALLALSVLHTVLTSRAAVRRLLLLHLTRNDQHHMSRRVRRQQRFVLEAAGEVGPEEAAARRTASTAGVLHHHLPAELAVAVAEAEADAKAHAKQLRDRDRERGRDGEGKPELEHKVSRPPTVPERRESAASSASSLSSASSASTITAGGDALKASGLKWASLTWAERRGVFSTWAVIAVAGDVCCAAFAAYAVLGGASASDSVGPRVLLGLGCALQWGAGLEYLEFASTMFTLIATLRQSVPGILKFLVEATPLFFAFTVVGTAAFGSAVPRFGSLPATGATLFAILNGDVLRETYLSLTEEPDVHTWFALLFLFSFLCIFMYVVLKVLLAMIEEALESQSVLAIRDEERQRQLKEEEAAANMMRDGRGRSSSSSSSGSSSSDEDAAAATKPIIRVPKAGFV